MRRTFAILGGISLAASIALAQAKPASHTTLPQFAQYVVGMTRDIVGQGYPGVSIVALPNKTLRVYDDTIAKSAVSGFASGFGSGLSTMLGTGVKTIAFTDLIGQPTWLSPLEISVTCVMRADIHPGDVVTLPTTVVGIAPNSPSAFLSARSRPSFVGSFAVQTVRHVGNFRTADGRAWTTVLNCLSPQSNLGTGAPASSTAPIQPPGVSSKVPPWSGP